MTVAVPTNAVTRWIGARLAADPATAAVPYFVAAATSETPRPEAGQMTKGPYITIRHLGSDDGYYLGARRGWSNHLYEVTAWDEGTGTGRLKPIVEGIHAALNRRSAVVDGVEIASCLRAAPVERQVEEGKKLFTQLGGEYRLRTIEP